MLVLHRNKSHMYPNKLEIVAIFGIGLIGTSIARALARTADFSIDLLALDWEHTPERGAQLAAIRHYILKQMKVFVPADSDRLASSVAVVWSAGKGGIRSSADELAPEMAAFEQVVGLTKALSHEFPEVQFTFHMLSSAGGLFEGQRCVGATSQPQPRNPYGELKLKQEWYAAEHLGAMGRFIYRPSSVYGFNQPGKRMGLIPTLIEHGIRHQVSKVYGGMNTMRDFVLVDDVGRFIAAQILAHQPTAKSAAFILASGRPTSIFQVIHLIQKAIKRDVYVHYREDRSTDPDNTYQSGALPRRWVATDLETGIRNVYHGMTDNLANHGFQ